MSIRSRIRRMESEVAHRDPPHAALRNAIETLIHLGLRESLPDPDYLVWRDALDLRTLAFPDAGPWPWQSRSSP